MEKLFYLKGEHSVPSKALPFLVQKCRGQYDKPVMASCALISPSSLKNNHSLVRHIV